MPFLPYRCPGVVAFLDDDLPYLESLADVLPDDWSLRMFQRPSQFIKVMQSDSMHWGLELAAHQKIVQRQIEGGSLIAEILRYWQEDGYERYGRIRVGVLDHSMPAKTGIDVLSDLGQWPALRILLTGQADEQIAIKAFNAGLIHQFITKHSPTLRADLIKAVMKFFGQSTQQRQSALLSSVSRDHLTALDHPSVSEALGDYAAKSSWVEYALIGAPFGILALDSRGRASWLQLELRSNLIELSEMAESQGWDAATVASLKQGKTLIDLELQLALSSKQKARPRTAFTLGNEAHQVFAAQFEISADDSPGPSKSFDAFRARYDSRIFEDR